MKQSVISFILTVWAFTILSAFALAQNQTAPPPPPCSEPEFRQLDFWVGQWEINGRYRTSDTSWAEGTATNTITIDYDSCVIIENFRSEDFGLNGHSVSTFNRRQGQWRQTWVDNTGEYLDFVGGLDSTGRMILYNERKIKDKSVKYRMVFQDIKKNSIFWTWERLESDGSSWKSMFELHYKRKK